MIEIAFRSDQKTMIALDINGHAETAPVGEDLVCAAVSTLGYTAMQYMSFFDQVGWVKEEPEMEEESGSMHLYFVPCKDRYNMAFHAMFTLELGFKMLQQNYPNAVRIVSTLIDQA